MMSNQSPKMLQYDILIVGASAGGTAAALAAASTDAKVCLIEETNWLGGQLTAQGVSTPDEHNSFEQFGGTRRYYEFRQAIRNYYRSNYKLSPKAAADPYFNPGDCWVSPLSFEPKVGRSILHNMLAPLVGSGCLTILFETRVVSCVVENDQIMAVTAYCRDSSEIQIKAQYILDATDLGNLLPLCGKEGLDWIVGAESRDQTGEPDAPDTYRPDWVQPFTFPFVIEWSPETSSSNVILPPHDYQELKALQKYKIKHGAITGLFSGAMPWWNYRRLLSAKNFVDPRITKDICAINTAGNDYYGGNIIGALVGDENAIRETLARARQASLGFLYWLQTECPREDTNSKKTGYPEIKLRLDIFDTADGLAPQPYIRESRRIKALRPILEQEIVVADFKGNPCRGSNARAVFMNDSIGIGHYELDIHPNGHGEPNAFVPTRPFQIPLGAMIPVRLKNYLPACKNIATTHLTNGAYRLHHIEWNIGESAGLTAAFCLKQNCTPKQIYQDKQLLGNLQSMLIENGISLNWYDDVPPDHFAFEAVQKLALTGMQLGSETNLFFQPDQAITADIWRQWVSACGKDIEQDFKGTRAEAAVMLANFSSIAGALA